MLIDKFDAVHFKMSETVAKLATAHADMPKPMGYCWGPDPPIIILDALGRQMCFPLILASSPDVRFGTLSLSVLQPADLCQ